MSEADQRIALGHMMLQSLYDEREQHRRLGGLQHAGGSPHKPPGNPPCPHTPAHASEAASGSEHPPGSPSHAHSPAHFPWAERAPAPSWGASSWHVTTSGEGPQDPPPRPHGHPPPPAPVSAAAPPPPATAMEMVLFDSSIDEDNPPVQ